MGRVGAEMSRPRNLLSPKPQQHQNCHFITSLHQGSRSFSGENELKPPNEDPLPKSCPTSGDFDALRQLSSFPHCGTVSSRPPTEHTSLGSASVEVGSFSHANSNETLPAAHLHCIRYFQPGTPIHPTFRVAIHLSVRETRGS